MSWPEAIVILGALGTFCFVLLWLAQGEELDESSESEGFKSSGPSPLWPQTTRPKDPPPAKVGQGGSRKIGTGPNVAGPPDRPKPPIVPHGQGKKTP